MNAPDDTPPAGVNKPDPGMPPGSVEYPAALDRRKGDRRQSVMPPGSVVPAASDRRKAEQRQPVMPPASVEAPAALDGSSAERQQSVMPPGSVEAPAAAGPGSEVKDFREGWDSAMARRKLEAPRSRASRRRAKRVWLYVLAVVALAAWIFDIAFQAPVVKTLPFTVLGVWRTSTPSYASRRLHLRANSLLFQISDSALMLAEYDIARVRQSPTPDGTRFIVDYFAEGTSGPQLTFTFILRSKERPEIIFAEQRHMVWMLDSGEQRATP